MKDGEAIGGAREGTRRAAGRGREEEASPLSFTHIGAVAASVEVAAGLSPFVFCQAVMCAAVGATLLPQEDLRVSGMSGVFFSILADAKQFRDYNYRENTMHQDDDQ